MIRRNITPRLLAALGDTPVVFLQGARQTGKSTLVRAIAAGDHAAGYYTLDDPAVLAAAAGDPAGFVAGLDRPVVLDEVQKAPGLFPAIKRAVDRDRRPGRFILTGSANVLLVPRVSESLAGRIEVLTLWPFSQGERAGVVEGFVDAVFGDRLPPVSVRPGGERDLLGLALAGGYPEVVLSRRGDRRAAWFGSYVATILQRDIRDLANIEGLVELPRLLTMLATRSGSLLNYADVARDLGAPVTTLRRYFALLEMAFLVQVLPSWSADLGKRLVKAPKLYLTDTGLLAHLLGLDRERLRTDSSRLGRLVENFVVMELRKQASWSRAQPAMFHFRTPAGHEVDIVLEDRAGRLVGIEVKAGATLGPDSVRGLRTLAEAVGRRFHRGIVLYGGSETVPFAENLHALPIPALWLAGAADPAHRRDGRKQAKRW